MESSNGSGNSDIKSHHHHLEKKRLNRAPSPARPLLKDVHSRSPKQSAIVPKSPKLIKQQPSSVSLATQSRVSRRTVTGSKEKSAPAKSNTKSSLTKKAVKATQHAATEQKIASKVVDSSPHLIKSKKGRLAPLSQGPLGHGSPIRVPTGATLGRVSQTDSSSDLSDCPSEPLSDEQRLAQAASSDAESGTGSGSSDRDQVAADNPLQPASSTEAGGGAAARLRSTDAGAAALAAPGGRGAMSQATPVPGQPSTGALTVKCKPEKPATSAQSKGEPGKDFAEEDLLREIEDLRSENDYLKDEVEELRAEMEELRDSYLEEEVYQLQELRRELDRSNKNCRILQYRLRKAEQRSLRVAQTGHVDGELLRSLEQDLKVAKDVSVRLHNELESVEDKRTRAEDENELLRQRVIEIEISKQALSNELDRVKETALRRRGSRETFKDKKSLTQEDSADLRCQLQFAKEESALMRKKMAKLGREKDELEQELQKYKSVYGDVDSPLPVAELTGGGPHSTREAELRLRLKLVEEEANILGRKIVELEVENRGLRAENEDLRCQYERDCLGREPFSSVPTSPYGGDALESAGELRRHLQFVEEEAELLRRSISEIEDHNKQLTTELNRFKFGPSTGDGEEGVEAGGGGASKPGNGGGSGLGGGNGSGLGANSGGGLLQEELKAARLQINELSGKVMKLQYENRVLISNMQRCDLAAHLGTRSASPPDAETELRRREGEDEDAGPMLLLHPKREGPVGGESDSEDLFERTATSGFGSSGKPSSDMGELVELAHRRKEDQETLSNVKREAERLGKTVERLISDTDSLIFEGRLVVTGAEALSENTGGVGRADGDSPDAKPDSQVLDSISSRMKAFRTELHIFMEKVDHLGEGLRDRGDDLSPMPHLTESSSFLSTVTSMSRDSPIGTLGRDLVTDFQSGRRDEPEWALGQQRGVVEVQGPGAPLGPSALRGTAGPTRYSRSQSLRAEIRDLSVPDVSTPARELQFRLEHERRLRVGQDEREGMPASITQEARRGLELQGLQPHEPAWPQERELLQQEVRLFRHNTVILYMKLRWILMHWRLGRRAEATEEGAHAEYERLENIPEMGVAMEPGEEGTDRGDRLFPQITGGDAADLSTTLLSPEPFQYQKQVGDSRRVLHALRSLLEEFRLELREEEQRRCQLQQTYANERAAWEVQRAEMRSLTTQLEEARGEAQAAGGGADPMQEEREEQRRLLAESHSASLELRWKLQHSEKRWSRERTEMLERFERERRDWEWSMRDMHRKMEKMQRELANRHGEGAAQVEEKEGGLQHVFSPQDSPSKPPRSPRSPRPPCTPPGRSYSDSEATVEERGAAGRPRPTESLFLDALSLDPLSEVEVPPPSRLESEKRFPCMKEALNEISERGDAAAYAEEDMCSGSLLRAKSVCSMSDFQRLMDSSPFLPDKNKQGESGPDEATPPLSPDDLKYIEEFKSASPLPPCPIPGPALSLEAWADRTEGRRADPTSEAFQTAAWFLTTSATLTTNTLSSPEHCRRPSLRSAGSSAGPDHLGVHVLHSPTRTSAAGDRPGPAALEQETGFSTKARGGEAGGGEEVFGGRWGARDLRGGIRPGERPVCAVASYASALELELSRNLSDDMKEVAVRNAIRSGSSPPERQLRDTACQTNGFTTRGTQTTQTISVGLQTEGLRALTSSPHRCHTPKAGGSTPISSPSRSLRKMQYSPVVQSKFERPCCSPKYGSPKLQRKPSNAGKTEPPAAPPARAPTPTTPQKGNSESAWARSTTTRDSPVHTTINDGLSSLFNIIDHTPLAHEAMQKYNKSPSRSRPAEAAGPAGAVDPKPPGLGGAHEGLLRNSRGRSPSPVQLIVETQGERTPEVSVRQDLSAPPGYTLAENAARILNKKLLEQSFREERRLPTATLPAAQGRGADAEKPVCIEDLPRSPVAPPLDSRFLRPARPAKRRPPSRWAAHSPSSSPSHKDQRERKFRFPSPMRPAQTIPELEEPGQEPWQPST